VRTSGQGRVWYASWRSLYCSIARAVKETLEAELMRKYYGRSELIEDDNNNSPLEWYVSSYIGIKSVRL